VRAAVFYHCWCGGQWRPIVQRYLAALRDVEDFPGELHVGLVGPASTRDEARALFREAFPQCELFEADEGHEPFTLGRVHDYACANDGAVFYAHTHGAWHPNRPHEQNQRKMVERLVGPWRQCVASLQAGAAVVGDGPLAGNTWWARCDWLRRLTRPTGWGRTPNGEMWSVDTDCWVWPARSGRATNGDWLAQPPGGSLSDQAHAELQVCKRQILERWRRQDWDGVRRAIQEGLRLDSYDWELMVTENRLEKLEQDQERHAVKRARLDPQQAIQRDREQLDAALKDPDLIATLRASNGPGFVAVPGRWV
jgi:hypothetical protein